MKHALRHTRNAGSSRDAGLSQTAGPSRYPIVVNYFFNARGAPLEKTRLGLMRSLLLQLGHEECSILPALLQEFRKQKKMHGDTWEWHLADLEDCLLNATKIQQRPIVLFVDALDECEETEVRKIVQFFESLAISAFSRKFTFKVLFSSRHYPNIRISNSVPIHVEDHNDRDISAYVRQKFALERGRYNNYLLSEEVIKRAPGVFLWVVLVVDLLIKDEDDGETLATKRKRLSEVPAELDELFEHLLQKTSATERQETCELMQWVLTAFRPLAPSMLCHALAFGQSSPYKSTREWETSDAVVKSQDQFERLIRTRSKGLVEVVHHVWFCVQEKRYAAEEPCRYHCYVQFIHESIRSFLKDKGFRLLDPSLDHEPVGQCHNRVAWSMIKYIGLQDPPLPLENSFLPDLYENFQGLLGYSVWNLLRHADQAAAAGVSKRPLRQSFQEAGKSRTRWFMRCFVAIEERWEAYETSRELLPKALSLGVKYGSPIFVELLLQEGADPNPGLDHAISEGDKTIVSLCLKYGANIKSKFYHGETALHRAAKREDYGLTSLLLRAGADITAENDDGWTALHFSAAYGHERVAAALLEHGADVKAKDNRDYGGTQLSISVQSMAPEVFWLFYYKVAQILRPKTKTAGQLSISVRNMATNVLQLLYCSTVQMSTPKTTLTTQLSISMQYKATKMFWLFYYSMAQMLRPKTRTAGQLSNSVRYMATNVLQLL